MYNNFETLEKKCKSYYFKQNLKIVTPLVLFVVVFVAGFGMFLQKNEKDIKQQVIVQKQEVKVVTVKKKEKKDDIVKQKIVKKENKKEKVLKVVKQKVLEVKPIYKDVSYSIEVDESYVPQVKRVEHKKVIKKVEKPKVEKPKFKPLKMSVKKVTDIEEMIGLYNKEKNYNLAIKISKAYFKKKKYTKSMLWAKKANILNRKDEKAWILYAKSEYARGNSKRAIEILKLYLANTSSSNARTLLLNWSEGK